jgi:hypothetical protein
LLFVTSTTVDVPLRSTHRSLPLGLSPIAISSSMSIHLFCNGARFVDPIELPPSSSWIFWVLPERRSDMVRIGALPVPGTFICMMWVNFVVPLSVPGMNIDWVNRHAEPLSRIRSAPAVRIPRTSLRCRSVDRSRSTLCITNRYASPSTEMCGCPAGCESARSSSMVSKAPSPSAAGSGAHRGCHVAVAAAAGAMRYAGRIPVASRAPANATAGRQRSNAGCMRVSVTSAWNSVNFLSGVR